MKKSIILFSLIILTFTSSSLLAQYIVEAKNDVRVSSTVFEFDIFIAPVSGSFELASLQVALYFDNNVKSGGTVTGVYIAGTSDLANTAQYPNNPNLDLPGQFRIAGKFPPGAGNGSIISGPTRFGRFRLTNSVSFSPVITPNFYWNFTPGSGQYVTILAVYVGSTNTNVTSSTTFSNNLSNNPLPIELQSFSASVTMRDVNLLWQTKTEINSYMFEIQRTENDAADTWQKIGELPAAGNSSSPKEYRFSEKRLNSRKYFYRLKMIDNDGTFKYSDVVEAEVALPNEYAISQNYPNPFNPTTRIDYQLPFDSNVKLELYSIAGEKTATIINEFLAAGYYTVEINSNSLNLASGVYIYRITAQHSSANNFLQVKKLVLMK